MTRLVPAASTSNTTRMLFIVASTLITASAVSMCGQVGWIGLLIPHASRMLVGSNNRYVVPLSLSLGASFMILIDTLSPQHQHYRAASFHPHRHHRRAGVYFSVE